MTTTPTATRPTTTRLAANALVQAGGTVASSLISVVTFAAITRYLGPEGYGRYAAATSFVFIPTVLADLGLSAAVLPDVARTPDKMQDTIAASLLLRVAVALIAVAGTVACALACPCDDPTGQA